MPKHSSRPHHPWLYKYKSLQMWYHFKLTVKNLSLSCLYQIHEQFEKALFLYFL